MPKLRIRPYKAERILVSLTPAHVQQQSTATLEVCYRTSCKTDQYLELTDSHIDESWYKGAC